MTVSAHANFDGPMRNYAKSVDITARVAIGATGAPTLIPGKSRGVISVTRNSTGQYSFVFGNKVNGRNVLDGAAWTENVEVQPDVSVTANIAPAAVGVPAILRDDITSGLNLPAPTNGAAAAVGSGGTFAAGTFFWKVTAVDFKGKESLASAEFQQTLVLNGSATLTWTATPGAASYRVYRGTSAGAESVVYVATTNSFTDTNAATQASATADPPIQCRPPLKAASVTVQLVNGSGTATDPASGEILRFTFTFIDTSA